MKKIAKFVSGTVKAVVEDNERIMLISKDKLWKLPGGLVADFDESPIIACEREVVEETGFNIEIEGVEDVSFHSIETKEKTIHIVFKAKLKERVMEQSENLKVGWFTRQQVLDMLTNNEIYEYDKKFLNMFLKDEV